MVDHNFLQKQIIGSYLGWIVRSGGLVNGMRVTDPPASWTGNTGLARRWCRGALRWAVRGMHQLHDRWRSQSLAVQFLLAGGLVSFAAMVIVGILVTRLIEDGVTRNSAATTALYVDSVIAPLLPDMQRNEVLDDTVTRALDETLGQGALGNRLLSFRLWRHDGTILYAKDKSLIGKRFKPGQEIEAAFSGELVAEFSRPDDVASDVKRGNGTPLLEIYNPVLQPWSGEVVAVSEFYEIATDFERNLNQARVRSWFAVTFVTMGFFLILSAIVVRGSQMIDRQSRALRERVGELSELLAQNKSLRVRVQRASQRAAALNERYLRRIGADLHDGPAQLLAFAALRLDSAAMTDPAAAGEMREREILAIKSSLDDAMREIRSICNGLILPHIEAAELPEILALAVRAHEQRTNASVELSLSDTPQPLSPSAKICIYRFVQEALNNGYRHGGGIGQSVTQTSEAGRFVIEVADSGPGFDPAAVRPEGLGLAGLRERVESLGGRFAVESSENGTRVRMSLNTAEMEQA
jgi:signal transduction histidine kinase